MTHPAMLLLGLVIGLIGGTYSERFVPLSDSFQRTTETLLPCGGRCLVESYRKLVEANDHCVMSNTGILPRIITFLQDNNLIDDDMVTVKHPWQTVYDVVFKQAEPLCGWFEDYHTCFEDNFGGTCGQKVKTELARILLNFKAFVCSTPSFLGCLVPPALIRDYGPYGNCARLQNIRQLFDYKDGDNTYFENLILNRELFPPMRGLGQCIGDAITSNNQACSEAGTSVTTYIKDAVDYFDFGATGGKDYLKCFANPAILGPLTSCGNQFVEGVANVYNSTKSVNPKNQGDPEFEAELLKYINVTVFYRRAKELAGPVNIFSSCLKAAVADVCRNEQDSVNMVNKILLPLDQYFNPNVKDDIEKICPGLVGASSRGGQMALSASVEVTLTGLCAGLLAMFTSIMRQP